MKGIDVSRHEAEIDWERVAGAGIRFAMLKASQGGGVTDSSVGPFKDTCFDKNTREASRNGILCGAYHYLTGTNITDVENETRFFIDVLKPYKDNIKFPCAIDIEEKRYRQLSKNENSNLILAFCRIVRQAGFVPVLYTNRDFSTYVLNMDMLKDIDIWYARYHNPRSGEKKPADLDRITIWQWNEKGVVDGINKNVDLNMGYFDYSSADTAGESEKFNIGDIVSIKTEAERYFPDGAFIPRWVREDYLHIITAVQSRGKDVYKNGSRCVLLGKRTGKKNKKSFDGIMTWTAVENLEKQY